MDDVLHRPAITTLTRCSLLSSSAVTQAIFIDFSVKFTFGMLYLLNNNLVHLVAFDWLKLLLFMADPFFAKSKFTQEDLLLALYAKFKSNLKLKDLFKS